LKKKQRRRKELELEITIVDHDIAILGGGMGKGEKVETSTVRVLFLVSMLCQISASVDCLVQAHGDAYVSDNMREASSADRMLALVHTFNTVLHKNNAFDVYLSMRLLLHCVCDVTPLEQAVLFLTIYCIARQCSKGQELRTPLSFEGGSLNLQTYLQIIKLRNPMSGLTIAEIIPNMDRHPVYKDEASNVFFEMGKEWWHKASARSVASLRDRAIPEKKLHDNAMMVLTALTALEWADMTVARRN
jgi:hypothetical protein